MRKIPSLFVREFGVANDTGVMATDAVNLECEWVMRGEGRATVKEDGTACMVRDGRLYKRFDRKRGKPAPEGWDACEEAPDPVTGHWPGWIPVGEGPEDRWHREVILRGGVPPDGTYELIGQHFNGNPHKIPCDMLTPHGARLASGVSSWSSVTFEAVRDWLETHEEEGIVWHHPDGRMAKIKRTDFGLEWPIKDDE